LSVSKSSPARSFLDPDSALKVLSLDPFNAETRLRCLDDDVTPVPKFYKRNHFSMPDIDAAGYRLSIEGAVENPLQISYDDIRSLPQVTLAVTLECAGNGRSAFSPEVGGEPWEFGAVGTAEWTGTSLSRVLHQALVKPEAVEVVTEGADHGVEACAQMSYSRSLSLSEALHPDTLLVWSMNRSALTPEHGFPIRLLVPGWYGMASVKWLTRIKVIEESFRGFFQADRASRRWLSCSVAAHEGALNHRPPLEQ
jgi:DMSO/TMAO reductase YedYZ molybdopterin-dependent catalytic subunit